MGRLMVRSRCRTGPAAAPFNPFYGGAEGGDRVGYPARFAEDTVRGEPDGSGEDPAHCTPRSADRERRPSGGVRDQISVLPFPRTHSCARFRATHAATLVVPTPA